MIESSFPVDLTFSHWLIYSIVEMFQQRQGEVKVARLILAPVYSLSLRSQPDLLIRLRNLVKLVNHDL